VEHIYLEKGGFFEFLANNIAIVVLKHRVSFSYYVAPVCIDFDGKYNVINGYPGKVSLLYYLNIKIVI